MEVDPRPQPDSGVLTAAASSPRDVTIASLKQLEDSLTSMLSVRSAADALDWYAEAVVTYQTAQVWRQLAPLNTRLAQAVENQFGWPNRDTMRAVAMEGEALGQAGNLLAAEASLCRVYIQEHRADDTFAKEVAATQLGKLMFDYGRYAEALAFFEEKDALCEQSGRTAGKFWIARTLRELGRVDEAEEWFRKSMRSARCPSMAALDSIELARTLARRGHLRDARSLFGAAHELANEVASDESEIYYHAVQLHDLGRLAVELRLEEAESILQHAQGHTSEVLGDQHPVMADCLSDIAVLREREGAIEDATSLLKQALAIHRSHRLATHPAVARVKARLTQLIRDHRR